MTQRVLGILRLNDSDIALDAAHLIEVVRLETPLSPRPLAPRWSLGTLLWRGSPVPAIDLGRLLELDPSTGPREAGELMAIIEYRGGRFGMRISHIRDLVSVDPEQLHTLKNAAGDADALTPQLLEHPDFDSAIYVLDLEALFALEGMVSVHVEADRQRTNAATVKENTHSDRRWLVVDCDDTRLALDVGAVREVATCGPIDSPMIDLPAYLGNVTLRGATLPLFDPRALIGQPARQTPPSHLAVLDSDHGRVALAVDRVATLTGSDQPAPLPVSPSAGYAPAVSALVPAADEGKDALAIDHHELFGNLNVNALARLHTRLDTEARQAREQREWQRFAFVHFRCGGDYVTTLDQLEAVDSAPTDYQKSSHPAGPFLGAWRRQDRSVSLVDLRALLGIDSSHPANHVLVVETGDGLVGFLVDYLRRIEYVEAPRESFTIRWRGDAIDGASPEPSPVKAAKRLISVGEGDKRQVMALLCLQTLAKRLSEAGSTA
ncbi:chemotaxis protein CheW [Salinicola sp. NYA28a]